MLGPSKACPQNATLQAVQCLMVGKQLNTYYYYYFFRTEICSFCEIFKISKIRDCRIHLNGPRAAEGLEEDRLKKWAHMNQMRLSKAKHKVLQLGQRNPDMSTDCENNSLTAALWRRAWGHDGQKLWFGPIQR